MFRFKRSASAISHTRTREVPFPCGRPVAPPPGGKQYDATKGERAETPISAHGTLRPDRVRHPGGLLRSIRHGPFISARLGQSPAGAPHAPREARHRSQPARAYATEPAVSLFRHARDHRSGGPL